MASIEDDPAERIPGPTCGSECKASTSDDIVGPAVQAENDMPGSLSLHPTSSTTIRQLAELDVNTLALMHGSAFTGDCHTALIELADDFERRIAALVK
ncbi:MAG: hypothetical protein ACSLFB_10895 [Acidimicrobiales bacterium]